MLILKLTLSGIVVLMMLIAISINDYDDNTVDYDNGWAET